MSSTSIHYIRNNLCELNWSTPKRRKSTNCCVIPWISQFDASCLRSPGKALSVEDKPRKCLFYLSPIYFTFLLRVYIYIFYFLNSVAQYLLYFFSIAHTWYYICSICSRCVFLSSIPFHFRYFQFSWIVWFYFVLRGRTYIRFCCCFNFSESSVFFSRSSRVQWFLRNYTQLQLKRNEGNWQRQGQRQRRREKSVMHKVRMMFRGHTRKHFISTSSALLLHQRHAICIDDGRWRWRGEHARDKGVYGMSFRFRFIVARSIFYWFWLSRLALRRR